MADQIAGMDALKRQLDAYVVDVQQRVEVAANKIMLDLETWAKAEHPYQDDTGANTASIRGYVTEATPYMVRGVLSAGMEYSVFLELARNGKYAFLAPVVERHKSEITQILNSLLKR